MRQTIRSYAEVVATRAPLQIRGDGAWYAQEGRTFDAILLPLAEDGETVNNKVFGAFVFVWNNRRHEVVEFQSA